MQDIADEMGATPVNNELAVGFDARLEHRFVYRQWAGQFFLLLVILSACLAAAPIAVRSRKRRAGNLHVDYEPVAEYGTPTKVTLRFGPVGRSLSCHECSAKGRGSHACGDYDRGSRHYNRMRHLRVETKNVMAAARPRGLQRL